MLGDTSPTHARFPAFKMAMCYGSLILDVAVRVVVVLREAAGAGGDGWAVPAGHNVRILQTTRAEMDTA